MASLSDAGSASAASETDFQWDAFLSLAPESDTKGREIAKRLSAYGLRVYLPFQETLASAMPRPDEAQEASEAAKRCAKSVILLSKSYFQHIESGLMGNTSMVTFKLSQDTGTGVVLVALERQFLDPARWGWNAVFARASGRPIIDLSCDMDSEKWHAGIAVLASGLGLESPVSPKVMTAAGPFPGFLGELARSDLYAPWMLRESGQQQLADQLQRRYDCFLTHNWGNDEEGRDTHARVLRIAKYLRGQGLEVFFDDWEMQRYASIDHAMVDGMKNSMVSAIFLTRKYIQKIEGNQMSDNCVAEFNLSRRAPAVVPVIMEENLRGPPNWGSNTVYAELGGKLYVDLSSNAGNAFSMLWSCSSRRWFAGLDSLEMRLRQEAAESSFSAKQPRKAVRHRLPPTVPHRDLMRLISIHFLVATIFMTISFIFAKTDIVWHGDVTLAVSGAFWTCGFLALALWHELGSRSAPEFSFDMVKLNKVALLATLVKAVASMLFLVSPIMRVNSALAAEVSLLEELATFIFLGGNTLSVLDSFIFSRNSPGGFDTSRPFVFGNRPHWAMVLLFLATCLLAMADVDLVSDLKSFALRMLACGMLLLSSLVYLNWSTSALQSLQNYYIESPTPHEGHAKLEGSETDSQFSDV